MSTANDLATALAEFDDGGYRLVGAIATGARKLLTEFEELQESAIQNACPDPDLHHDVTDDVIWLPRLVLEMHERDHSDPWAACRFEVCKVAAQQHTGMPA